MKGVLKKTVEGWFVLYQVMRDELTSGYDFIRLHPDSQSQIDGYNLNEGSEIEFDVRVYPSGQRWAKTTQESTICEYSGLASLSAYENKTPNQVILGDKSALIEGDFFGNYKFNKEIDSQISSEIEHLIIQWNIDGTKTAGSLTRDIMKLIESYEQS